MTISRHSRKLSVDFRQSCHSRNCRVAIRRIPGSLHRLARNFVRAFLRARARWRCPRTTGRQLRMPVVALARGLIHGRARAHAWEQRLSSSRSSPLAAVVGHRTRGRSKINGHGGYVRSLLAAATTSEDRRGRGRITAHALYLRCIPKPPTTNYPRTHVVVWHPKSCAAIGTRFFA